MPIFLFGFLTFNFWISILMMIPTYLDGTIQAIYNRESNNFIRVTSGFIAGVGSMSLISIVGKKIGDYILLII